MRTSASRASIRASVVAPQRELVVDSAPAADAQFREGSREGFALVTVDKALQPPGPEIRGRQAQDLLEWGVDLEDSAVQRDDRRPGQGRDERLLDPFLGVLQRAVLRAPFGDVADHDQSALVSDVVVTHGSGAHRHPDVVAGLVQQPDLDCVGGGSGAGTEHVRDGRMVLRSHQIQPRPTDSSWG